MRKATPRTKVALHFVDGAARQRDQPRLVELRPPNKQRMFARVVVGKNKPSKLAAAETCRVQQHDGDAKHRRAQQRRGMRREACRDPKELGDLLLAEDVRAPWGVWIGKPVWIGNEAVTAGTAQIETEIANDAHSFSPNCWREMGEAQAPCSEDLGRERAAPPLDEEAIEMHEHRRLGREATPESLFERQVGIDLRPEARSDDLPHGCTRGTSRAASRRSSTCSRR